MKNPYFIGAFLLIVGFLTFQLEGCRNSTSSVTADSHVDSGTPSRAPTPEKETPPTAKPKVTPSKNSPRNFRGWKAESIEDGKKIMYHWAALKDDPLGAEYLPCLKIVGVESDTERGEIKGKIGSVEILMQWKKPFYSLHIMEANKDITPLQESNDDGVKLVSTLLQKKEEADEKGFLPLDAKNFATIMAELTEISLAPIDGDFEHFDGRIIVLTETVEKHWLKKLLNL